MAKKKKTHITDRDLINLGFVKVKFEHERDEYYYEYEFKNVQIVLLSDFHKKGKWKVNIYEGGLKYFSSLEDLTAFMEIIKRMK